MRINCGAGFSPHQRKKYGYDNLPVEVMVTAASDGSQRVTCEELSPKDEQICRARATVMYLRGQAGEKVGSESEQMMEIRCVHVQGKSNT